MILKMMIFCTYGFQSTLSQGERLIRVKIRRNHPLFQSTLSQGERPYWRVYNDWFRDISIHALARRATTAVFDFILNILISIHALARRATVPYRLLWKNWKISIHALARRATYWRVYNDWFRDISIHALARRATPVFPDEAVWDKISIHALARRATCRRFDGYHQRNNFNPRSRKESDTIRIIMHRNHPLFQSTLSQGERRCVFVKKELTKIFQSTLSQGERLPIFPKEAIGDEISIHALARRATETQLNQIKGITISIHALARRATLIY